MAVTLLAAVVAVGGAAAATPLHLGETPFILPRTLFMLLPLFIYIETNFWFS